MATKGRETKREGSGGTDNVVQFPRDWIGPVEDLVPLGVPEPGPDSERELDRALGASAFWDESSASLHEAIEAPAPPRVPPVVIEP